MTDTTQFMDPQPEESKIQHNPQNSKLSQKQQKQQKKSEKPEQTQKRQVREDFSNLFGGADESELQRQTDKKERNARPDFVHLEDQSQQRRQEKQKRKLESKIQQGLVPQEDRRLIIPQIQEEKEPQPPKFITRMKDGEEIQQNLDDFIEEQYSQQHKRVTKYPKEIDFGNKEYKLRLTRKDINRLNHLTTQMNYRLSEGNGTAYYCIGVEDSGNALGIAKPDMLESLRTLSTMASSLKAEMLVTEIRQGLQGKICEMKIRKGYKGGIELDVRVLLLGETGSGKTSLLGVLNTGETDDGKGLARMKFLKNPNEILSGKTERVSHTVIGLDGEGKIINHQAQISFLSDVMIEKVVDLSSKLITFIDMGGHKKAHNQMIKILNSSFPDYALLVTSATAEITTFTEDYFKLLHVHQLPIMVVITHIDNASDIQVDGVVMDIKRVVKELEDKRIPIIVRGEEDIVLFSKQIFSNDIVPIFLLSNVTGQGISLLVKFLNLLPQNNIHIKNSEMATEFCINNVYELNDGIKVLGGTVIKGTIKERQILHIGPDRKGSFYPIEIQEVQCNRIKVKSAQCGQICSVQYKLLPLSGAIGEKTNPVRKGMVLVEGKTNPTAYWEFMAEIWLFDDVKQSKQLSYSFQPVINTQTARQICRIIPEPEEIMALPTLQKKKSKSIDPVQLEPEQKLVKQKKSGENNRKISADFKMDNHISPTVEKRKKSYSGLEKDPEQQSGQLQLFVINESKQKSETLTIHPGKGNFVRLRFMYNPEYIHKGMRLIINENQFRAVGWIKNLFY